MSKSENLEHKSKHVRVKLENMMESQMMSELTRANTNLKTYKNFRVQNEKYYKERELEEVRQKEIREPLDDALTEIDILNSKLARREDMIVDLRKQMYNTIFSTQETSAASGKSGRRTPNKNKSQEIADATLLSARNADQIDDLKRQNDAQQTEILKLKRVVDFQVSKIKDLNQEITKITFEAQEYVRKHEKELISLSNQVEKRDQDIQFYQQKVNKQEEIENELQSQYKQALEDIANHVQANALLQSRYDELVTKQTDVEEQLDLSKTEIEIFQEKNIMLQESVEDLNGRYDRLVQDLDHMVEAGYHIPPPVSANDTAASGVNGGKGNKGNNKAGNNNAANNSNNNNANNGNTNANVNARRQGKKVRLADIHQAMKQHKTMQQNSRNSMRIVEDSTVSSNGDDSDADDDYDDNNNNNNNNNAVSNSTKTTHTSNDNGTMEGKQEVGADGMIKSNGKFWLRKIEEDALAHEKQVANAAIRMKDQLFQKISVLEKTLTEEKDGRQQEQQVYEQKEKGFVQQQQLLNVEMNRMAKKVEEMTITMSSMKDEIDQSRKIKEKRMEDIWKRNAAPPQQPQQEQQPAEETGAKRYLSRLSALYSGGLSIKKSTDATNNNSNNIENQPPPSKVSPNFHDDDSNDSEEDDDDSDEEESVEEKKQKASPVTVVVRAPTPKAPIARGSTPNKSLKTEQKGAADQPAINIIAGEVAFEDSVTAAADEFFTDSQVQEHEEEDDEQQANKVNDDDEDDDQHKQDTNEDRITRSSSPPRTSSSKRKQRFTFDHNNEDVQRLPPEDNNRERQQMFDEVDEDSFEEDDDDDDDEDEDEVEEEQGANRRGSTVVSHARKSKRKTKSNNSNNNKKKKASRDGKEKTPRKQSNRINSTRSSSAQQTTAAITAAATSISRPVSMQHSTESYQNDLYDPSSSSYLHNNGAKFEVDLLGFVKDWENITKNSKETQYDDPIPPKEVCDQGIQCCMEELPNYLAYEDYQHMLELVEREYQSFENVRTYYDEYLESQFMLWYESILHLLFEYLPLHKLQLLCLPYQTETNIEQALESEYEQEALLEKEREKERDSKSRDGIHSRGGGAGFIAPSTGSGRKASQSPPQQNRSRPSSSIRPNTNEDVMESTTTNNAAASERVKSPPRSATTATGTGNRRTMNGPSMLGSLDIQFQVKQSLILLMGLNDMRNNLMENALKYHTYFLSQFESIQYRHHQLAPQLLPLIPPWKQKKHTSLYQEMRLPSSAGDDRGDSEEEDEDEDEEEEEEKASKASDDNGENNANGNGNGNEGEETIKKDTNKKRVNSFIITKEAIQKAIPLLLTQETLDKRLAMMIHCVDLIIQTIHYLLSPLYDLQRSDYPEISNLLSYLQNTYGIQMNEIQKRNEFNEKNVLLPKPSIFPLTQTSILATDIGHGIRKGSLLPTVGRGRRSSNAGHPQQQQQHFPLMSWLPQYLGYGMPSKSHHHTNTTTTTNATAGHSKSHTNSMAMSSTKLDTISESQQNKQQQQLHGSRSSMIQAASPVTGNGTVGAGGLHRKTMRTLPLHVDAFLDRMEKKLRTTTTATASATIVIGDSNVSSKSPTTTKNSNNSANATSPSPSPSPPRREDPLATTNTTANTTASNSRPNSRNGGTTIFIPSPSLSPSPPPPLPTFFSTFASIDTSTTTSTNNNNNNAILIPSPSTTISISTNTTTNTNALTFTDSTTIAPVPPHSHYHHHHQQQQQQHQLLSPAAVTFFIPHDSIDNTNNNSVSNTTMSNSNSNSIHMQSSSFSPTPSPTRFRSYHHNTTTATLPHSNNEAGNEEGVVEEDEEEYLDFVRIPFDRYSIDNNAYNNYQNNASHLTSISTITTNVNATNKAYNNNEKYAYPMNVLASPSKPSTGSSKPRPRSSSGLRSTSLTANAAGSVNAGSANGMQDLLNGGGLVTTALTSSRGHKLVVANTTTNNTVNTPNGNMNMNKLQSQSLQQQQQQQQQQAAAGSVSSKTKARPNSGGLYRTTTNSNNSNAQYYLPKLQHELDAIFSDDLSPPPTAIPPNSLTNPFPASTLFPSTTTISGTNGNNGMGDLAVQGMRTLTPGSKREKVTGAILHS